MMKKVAIAIIHGAGIHRQSSDDIDNMVAMQARLETKFLQTTGQDGLEFRLVYWDVSSFLQKQQDDLRQTLKKNGVNFDRWLDAIGPIRQYIFDRLGDIAAYQPVSDPILQEQSTYTIVHRTIAQSLAELSDEVGTDAPLCIIAHSLGGIIASNYIYDLRMHTPEHNLIPKSVLEVIGDAPLQKGETLRCLFTMGNPMALWRLRTGKLDRPIKVPLWINFFDSDDVVAYPLEELLIKDYGEIIVRDRRVETGMALRAHSGYWHSEEVIDDIVRYLINVWELVNKKP